MKIVTYNMLHNKRSTRNWSLILDKYDPDLVLAQESLAPAAYRMPLLDEFEWQGNTVWSPVNNLWGSAVYVKAETPRRSDLPEYRGWVVGVEISGADWLPLQGTALRIFSIHAPSPHLPSRHLHHLLTMDHRAFPPTHLGNIPSRTSPK
jgi:hypothetical protein